jgi:hypothetical protein
LARLDEIAGIMGRHVDRQDNFGHHSQRVHDERRSTDSQSGYVSDENVHFEAKTTTSRTAHVNAPNREQALDAGINSEDLDLVEALKREQARARKSKNFRSINNIDAHDYTTALQNGINAEDLDFFSGLDKKRDNVQKRRGRKAIDAHDSKTALEAGVNPEDLEFLTSLDKKRKMRSRKDAKKNKQKRHGRDNMRRRNRKRREKNKLRNSSQTSTIGKMLTDKRVKVRRKMRKRKDYTLVYAYVEDIGTAAKVDMSSHSDPEGDRKEARNCHNPPIDYWAGLPHDVKAGYRAGSDNRSYFQKYPSDHILHLFDA